MGFINIEVSGEGSPFFDEQFMGQMAMAAVMIFLGGSLVLGFFPDPAPDRAELESFTGELEWAREEEGYDYSGGERHHYHHWELGLRNEGGFRRFRITGPQWMDPQPPFREGARMTVWTDDGSHGVEPFVVWEASYDGEVFYPFEKMEGSQLFYHRASQLLLLAAALYLVWYFLSYKPKKAEEKRTAARRREREATD